MAGFEPRLPTKGAAPAAATPAPAARGVGGWPVKGQAAVAAQPAPVAQREAIRARVSAPMQPQVVLHEDQTEQAHEVRGAAPATGRGFFSKAVQTAIAPETEQPEVEQPDPAVDPSHGRFTPAGYAPGEAERLSANNQTVVMEPKPRAPRSRKTDTPAATLADAVSDVKGVDQVNYAAGALANGVSLNFHGLPPAAIKAALQAIVDNL